MATFNNEPIDILIADLTRLGQSTVTFTGTETASNASDYYYGAYLNGSGLIYNIDRAVIEGT